MPLEKEVGEKVKDFHWRPGYPPGKYYAGMFDDYEVYWSIAGAVWHRRRLTALEEEK